MGQEARHTPIWRMSLRSRKMKSLGLHLMQPLYSEHRSQPLGQVCGVSGLAVQTETGMVMTWWVGSDGTPRNKKTRASIQDIYFNKRIKERYATTLYPCEQHQGTLVLGWYLHTSSYKPSSTLTLQRWGLVLGAYSDRGPGQTASFGTFTHCLLQKCLLQIVNRFSFREIHGNWLLTTAQEPVKLFS